MVGCRRPRASEPRDVEETQIENLKVMELMGPKLTTVGRKNKDATAAMTRIRELHGGCGDEVELVTEAIVAFVEFRIYRNYEDILWPTTKREKKCK